METSPQAKFFFICIAFCAILGLADCNGRKASTSSGSEGVSQSMALARCQIALKAMSRDPESAEVPYVNNFGGVNEFYFAWGASTKPVRMKNGFGAILSAGASCIVDRTSGEITSITLDGKTMFGQ